MKRMQSGFTLIELVVVIVILGILAISAVPRFVDLSTDAADAALQGIKGAGEAAAAINYAQELANDTGKVISGAACSDVLSTDATAGLLTAALSTDITITGTVGATADGTVDTNCTISHPDDSADVTLSLIVVQ